MHPAEPSHLGFGPRSTFLLPSLLVAAASLCPVQLLHAQGLATSSSSRLPSFEVASIRAHEKGYWPTFERKQFIGDRFEWLNATTQGIIVYAFDLCDPNLGPNLIPGAPKWIRSNWYDIEARISDSDMKKMSGMTRERRDAYQRKLLQSLLADRFNLKSHLIAKNSHAYELALDRAHPKKLVMADPKEQETVNWVDPGDGQYQAVRLNAVTVLLQMLFDCPVVDKTGLTGRYDFELKWARTPETIRSSAPTDPMPADADLSRPSIFKALQEQLGLKLIPVMAPLQSIVIDHIDTPSPN